MTVTRLHKALGILIAEGHGRKPVCIDKRSFNHPLEEDGCTILGVGAVELLNMLIIDDDGGPGERKDGTERRMWTAVLYGDPRYRETGLPEGSDDED